MQGRIRRVEKLDVGQARGGGGFLSPEPCRNLDLGYALAEGDVLCHGRRNGERSARSKVSKTFFIKGSLIFSEDNNYLPYGRKILHRVMKIGFEETPGPRLPGLTPGHLAKLLAEYAPEHEYIVDGARYKELDLYHGFRPGLPLPLLRRIPSVMTVDNLNFLRYPHLYSLPERLVLLRLYRRALRSASRLITVNRDAARSCRNAVADRPGAHRGRHAPRRARPARTACRCAARGGAAQIHVARRVHPHARHRRRAP